MCSILSELQSRKRSKDINQEVNAGIKACLVCPGPAQTPKGATSVTKTKAANSKRESTETKTLRSGKVYRNPIKKVKDGPNPAKIPKGAQNVMKTPKFAKVSKRAVSRNKTHENKRLSNGLSGQGASPETLVKGRNVANKVSTTVKQGMKRMTPTPQPRANKEKKTEKSRTQAKISTPKTKTAVTVQLRGMNLITTKNLRPKANTPSKKQAPESKTPVEPRTQLVGTPPKRELASNTATSKDSVFDSTPSKSAGKKKPVKTPANEKGSKSIATPDQGPKKFVLYELTEFQQQALSSLGLHEIHDVE